MATENLMEPFTREKIRRLKVGDRVELSGRIFTGRDRLHRYLFDGGRVPVSLKNGAIFHCGPVVVRRKGQWVVLAAGPTTSGREDPYMPEIIRRTGLRLIIGKGGMGPETLAACRKYGCVYLHAVGGAAQVLAQKVARVSDVHFLDEFGSAEALWELEVRRFPALVTMDAHGRSLHAEVAKASAAGLRKRL